MKLNKDVLIKYEELRDEIENQAEKVIKEYFKFKGWKFPSDFSLEDVGLGTKKDVVYINYYGFQDYSSEVVPLEYFLTLDNNLLKK